MGDHQIHKRHSSEFVEEVLEAFNEKRMTEEMTCEFNCQKAKAGSETDPAFFPVFLSTGL